MIGIGDAFEKPFPETAAKQGQSSCSDVTSFSEMGTQASPTTRCPTTRWHQPSLPVLFLCLRCLNQEAAVTLTEALPAPSGRRPADVRPRAAGARSAALPRVLTRLPFPLSPRGRAVPDSSRPTAGPPRPRARAAAAAAAAEAAPPATRRPARGPTRRRRAVPARARAASLPTSPVPR